MSKHLEIPKVDITSLKDLDNKIQLCSIEMVEPYVPDNAEMESIINILTRFQELILRETSATEFTKQ